jgi:hypothetical protein
MGLVTEPGRGGNTRHPPDRTTVARMGNNSRFIRDYEIVVIAKCLRVPVASLFPE